MQKRTRQYEVMFLISQSAAADFNALIAHLNEIFARAHAEIIAMKKWDERRLAYEMDKQKRGVYILCYVRCDTRAIAGMERDCNLSEKIMRVMILRADHLSPDEITARDGRDQLATEAKLRAAEPPRTESVSAGAPRAAAAPTEPAPA